MNIEIVKAVRLTKDDGSKGLTDDAATVDACEKLLNLGDKMIKLGEKGTKEDAGESKRGKRSNRAHRPAKHCQISFSDKPQSPTRRRGRPPKAIVAKPEGDKEISPALAAVRNAAAAAGIGK